MKFLLITLVSTLAYSVTGQLVQAPEMVVFYVNEKAAPGACTEQDQLLIDSKMLPDIDMTLEANNYEAPDWHIAVSTDSEDGSGGMVLLSSTTSTCDFCKRLYPRTLCNAMYNCRFRRQLRSGPAAARTLQSSDGMAADLLGHCENTIRNLLGSKELSRSCTKAIRGATCHVEFI